MRKTQGSFLELELKSIAVCPENVWQRWTSGRLVATFASARAALLRLVQSIQPHKVWLPAYICTDVYNSLLGQSVAIGFYPLGEDLQINPSVLSAVMPGDLFLYVNYFGRLQAEEFVYALRLRTDVHRVEDNAHSLVGCKNSPADWQIFSPRKLLGVPDGGVLTSAYNSLPEFLNANRQPCLESCLSKIKPLIWGLEDPSRESGQYAAYRQAEDCTTADNIALSKITLALLERIPANEVSKKRMQNWQTLHELLQPWALWKDNWGQRMPPLCYPVVVNNPSALAKQLSGEKVFCARHWADIPSPATFKCEHKLSAKILSIPCDQRMEREDVIFVGKKVLSLLQGQQ